MVVPQTGIAAFWMMAASFATPITMRRSASVKSLAASCPAPASRASRVWQAAAMLRLRPHAVRTVLSLPCPPALLLQPAAAPPAPDLAAIAAQLHQVVGVEWRVEESCVQTQAHTVRVWAKPSPAGAGPPMLQCSWQHTDEAVARACVGCLTGKG